MKYLSFFTAAILSLALLSACNNNKTAAVTNPTDEDVCGNRAKLDSLIVSDSLNGEWYSCRALLNYNSGKYSDAYMDISNALQLKGNNIQDMLLLSDIYFIMGKVNEARAVLMEAKALDKYNYEVYYAIGYHNFLIGNMELAKGNLLKSIELHPENPQSYFVLGQIAALMEDTATAISRYQSAVQADINFYPAYLQLAVLYTDIDKKLVPEYLRNALTANPECEEALFLSGVFYQQEDSFDEAVSYYKKTFDVNPRNKMASFNIGYIYLTEYMIFDTAAIWFDKTLQIDSTFTEAKFNYDYALKLQEEQ
ncbi:MAG: hypothetical protein PHR20_00690 [Bacteroidales bacterium]|nr:hypothetical protein [Bacteroidales bacterium]